MSVSQSLLTSTRNFLFRTSTEQTLSHLKPMSEAIENFPGGTRVRITAIDGDPAHCHRLASMGIFPGREVQILRKQGQSLMVKHGHMCMGLRLSNSFTIAAEACKG